MQKLAGIGASKGIAIGKLTICVSIDDNNIEKIPVQDVPAELERLENAKRLAVDALNAVYLSALKRVGEKNSMIFQIHIMMLQDEDFFGAIRNRVRENKVNAESAVWETGKEFSNIFAQMEDEYMRGRAADVIDISKRMIRTLNPAYANGLDTITEHTVVAAADLMPSETVQIDPEKVLAFLTREGSKSSHSAILARTLGIPAVVGLAEQYPRLADGDEVIVDGGTGEVIVRPDAETLAAYRRMQAEYEQRRRELQQVRGTKAVTKTGIEIEINANIGHPGDVEKVLENDADGIGLFRSEFLYMENNTFPSEEQQFSAYRAVLEKMDGKRVIIRTLDLGADKQVPYLDLPKEENPALGYRAIRISLDRRELFVTQLRALARASAFGRLAVMFPMIISVDEVRECKSVLEQVKQQLSDENIAFAPDFEVGIMVETPAAVMMSAELAREIDFFSIGTNDLTQYTLAADRMNHKIADLFDSRNPAVLRMIEMTVENGKKAGIWTGICGESAADTALTEFYARIGVRELSVTPSAVLELKREVQQLSV
ncbi:MAG: phosphoenolpyruvate--protein phosphotransferase [Clostridiales bacterium]|nr:phosphoenolpyruvate--protein phosphotransferase [Clostridiales bacterium]